jgi:hypothetical protein
MSRATSALTSILLACATAVPALAGPSGVPTHPPILMHFTGVPHLVRNFPNAPKKLGNESMLTVLMDDAGKNVVCEVRGKVVNDFLDDNEILRHRKVTVWGTLAAADDTPDLKLQVLNAVSVEATDLVHHTKVYAIGAVAKDVNDAGGEEQAFRETYTCAAKADGSGKKVKLANGPDSGSGPATKQVEIGEAAAGFPATLTQDGNILLGGPKPVSNGFGESYPATPGLTSGVPH